MLLWSICGAKHDGVFYNFVPNMSVLVLVRKNLNKTNFRLRGSTKGVVVHFARRILEMGEGCLLFYSRPIIQNRVGSSFLMVHFANGLSSGEGLFYSRSILDGRDLSCPCSILRNGLLEYWPDLHPSPSSIT